MMSKQFASMTCYCCWCWALQRVSQRLNVLQCVHNKRFDHKLIRHGVMPAVITPTYWFDHWPRHWPDRTLNSSLLRRLILSQTEHKIFWPRDLDLWILDRMMAKVTLSIRVFFPVSVVSIVQHCAILSFLMWLICICKPYNYCCDWFVDYCDESCSILLHKCFFWLKNDPWRICFRLYTLVNVGFYY